MTKIDPERERARLAALYADMSDLELQTIAADPKTLTEWAQAALEEEMQKRGLQLPPRTETREPDRPVILRHYRDMPEAFIAKSVLENAGIECLLQDDNLVRMDWFWSNALGGIKLVVREKDVEEAEKILNDTSPIDPEDTSSN